MEYLNKYVPKEFLALKINYCRKCLEEMPKYVVAEHFKRGKLRKVIKVNNRRLLPIFATLVAYHDLL